MEKRFFYFDTCIWFNLFKNEGDATKGVPYCEIARELTDLVNLSKDCELILSPPVLRELKYKSSQKLFEEIEEFLEKGRFAQTRLLDEDVKNARKFESTSGYSISFYDCIHIAICQRLGAVLVTRDKELLRFTKRYIWADKPEDLIKQFI